MADPASGWARGFRFLVTHITAASSEEVSTHHSAPWFSSGRPAWLDSHFCVPLAPWPLCLRKAFPSPVLRFLPARLGSLRISLSGMQGGSDPSPVTPLRQSAQAAGASPNLPEACLLCIHSSPPHVSPSQPAPLKTTCFVF